MKWLWPVKKRRCRVFSPPLYSPVNPRLMRTASPIVHTDPGASTAGKDLEVTAMADGAEAVVVGPMGASGPPVPAVKGHSP